MRNSNALPFVAAGLFLVGLVLMLFITPHVAQPSPETTGPEAVITEATTETPTEPPTTEPPTEPPTDPPAETTPQTELGLTCRYSFVYDVDAGYPLYLGGDPDARVAPASLTKLLTARTALACMDPEATVTVGNEVTWIDPESSVAWLQPDHKLTVEMLVQGLIMQSGNDAAYTLAVAGGRALAEDASLDRRQAYGLFVDEMNKQVRELGLKNTHFMNPDGIDEEGHYTTVNDLIVMSLAAMEDPIIMKYAAMATADVEFVTGETCTWLNSNYLLHEELDFYTPEAIGLKTGSTSSAGKCLISLFDLPDGRRLLIGVLGSPLDEDRYKDTLILFDLYR